MTYVDTSLLAAYYCPESLSGRAQRALQETGELAISPLVEVELTFSIAGKVRTRVLGNRGALRILAVFESHLEQGIYTRLGVNAGHFAEARKWIATFKIPLQTLDALHVAVAEMNGCSILTADAQLARACTKVNVAARLIT